ncbi:sigma-70 family RNA polymerase sigma factor [Algicella marina]|uniref:Sigma-70 family RNA polymerase sigma factor n=1 Tax=Algicella marina TaxID=2683284 RepID=A0A6P1T736_9RHOB|nr:sigma-70 family RNA polymerase sigma factor [Algicella marina]
MHDRAAFSELYDATSAKLFGVCLRILKERSLAEDAMQDTFVKVWKNADRYQVNGLSPMTWLITIARNTAIDRLRRTKPDADLSDYAEVLPAPGVTPEGAAIAASDAKRLNGCLGELEEQRAEAVKAVYLNGWSYAELASSFDMPVNTVRTWLRRGLISLRECMSR